MCVTGAQQKPCFVSVQHKLLFFLSSDEFSQTPEATSQRHSVQADVRGAGEQHPAGHHECDIRLRGSEEERGLLQIPGTGVAGRQLHERRLEERPDVRVQHQLPLQGNTPPQHTPQMDNMLNEFEYV